MSGTKVWLFRLQDMIENLDFIEDVLRVIEKRTFLEDNYLQKAVERAYEIVGEAARNIPEAMRDKYTDVEWRKIIATRNNIAHGYLSVDYELLWNLQRNNFFGLREKLKQILEMEE